MSEERKLVTILFADVTGSTDLGETLDPEDVRALMGRYYQHAREVVVSYGGTIEKFIGDAIMAVFGLPQAHGDDAERALAAALALRTVVADDEVLGASFQLRFGVSTGEVVATSDSSRGDFLITGDAVNVAARLQQSANPGEIVANERTADAARTAFLFDKPRLIEVKGKKLPLHVFPLLGLRPARQVRRPALIGRKQDLVQLALLKERVLEEERPQLVSIIAPAGIGKTRLLEEFIERIDAKEGFQVATVRCLSYGQTLTYWPLQGLLEGMMLGEKITSSQVMDVFTATGFKRDDASRLADLILTTLGIESNNTALGAVDREAIFNAWRLLIEAFARLAPRILIFEDLHWASESMLDLVEHIISVRTHARLLLVVLSRPELLDRRPTWGGGRQNFTSLALQPLTQKQTQDLIDQLAKTLPDTVRQRIAERSGGNPFFALELLRGLVDRTVCGDNQISLDALPDTVHAAVLARLDLLSKPERTLLQVASVASRTFSVKMVQTALPDYTPQQMRSALDTLVQRDMLTIAEGDEYAFRHTLIRDVAYGTLTRAERIRLHSLMASWLEENGLHESYAAVAAYHYREAVQLARQSAVPTSLPRETERAVYYLTRAGAIAGRAGAITEARNYFQQALEFAPQEQHMQLYELLGDNSLMADTAAHAYTQAIEHWGQQKHPAALDGARLRRKLLIAYTRWSILGKPERAQIAELCAEAKQLADQSGDISEIWRVRVSAIFCDAQCLRPGEKTQQELIAIQRESLAAASYFEQQQDWTAFSEALDSAISITWQLDSPEEIIGLARRRLAVQALSPLERGDAINVLAHAYLLAGDYESCITTIKDALLRRRPDESLLYLAGGLTYAMLIATLLGRWDDVLFMAHVLKETWEQAQDDVGLLAMLVEGNLSLLQVAAAREDRPTVEAAFTTLNRYIQLYFEKDQYEQSSADVYRALLQAYRDDDVSYLQRYTSLPEKLHGLALFWTSFLGEHDFLTPEGIVREMFQGKKRLASIKRPILHIAQALQENDNERLAKGIEEAEQAQLVVHAARMRIVLAQRTRDSRQLERARSVLEPLADRRFLRRLEEVAGILGKKREV